MNTMNKVISSIPTQRISRVLLLVMFTSGVAIFFSACVGHEARVENRVDRRYDRRTGTYSY